MSSGFAKSSLPESFRTPRQNISTAYGMFICSVSTKRARHNAPIIVAIELISKIADLRRIRFIEPRRGTFIACITKAPPKRRYYCSAVITCAFGYFTASVRRSGRTVRNRTVRPCASVTPCAVMPDGNVTR
jgi:hypothetical protein